MAESVVHSLSVTFAFPLCFTHDTWDSTNTTFLDVIGRLEPDRQHRLLLVVDEDLTRAQPTLVADARAYVDAFPVQLNLVAEPLLVPGGEVVKNDLTQVTRLLQAVHDTGLDRQSFVVVIGGGAVLDMVSFAGAIAHGGMRVVRLPASVAGQAVSGVAVRSGVNLFGSKNFIGTFAPPFAVINDSALLASLHARDRVAGVAEAIRVAVQRDPVFFRYLEGHVDAIAAGDPTVLQILTRRSAVLQLQHVSGSIDTGDVNSVRPLDFGQWAAQGLESLTEDALRHGEAVAIGMALDTTYAVKAGYLPPGEGERILALLRGVGLRLWDPALQACASDGELSILHGLREVKDLRGHRVTLVRAPGESVEVTRMDEAVIRESVEALAAAWALHSPFR